MLDRDLTQLAAVTIEVALPGLEQAIWSKVDVMERIHRLEQLSSRVQVGTLIVVLVASATIGMAMTYPRNLRPIGTQISMVATDLAPSALLDLQH